MHCEHYRDVIKCIQSPESLRDKTSCWFSQHEFPVRCNWLENNNNKNTNNKMMMKQLLGWGGGVRTWSEGKNWQKKLHQTLNEWETVKSLLKIFPHFVLGEKLKKKHGWEMMMLCEKWKWLFSAAPTARLWFSNNKSLDSRQMHNKNYAMEKVPYVSFSHFILYYLHLCAS